MKKTFFFFLMLITISSCNQKSKTEQAVEAIPVALKVNRFDKAFFETNPNNLAQLKQEYPFFFPQGNDDKVWMEKMQNPQWRELYAEVEKKYSDFATETTQLEELFKHIKYYFPETKTPKVYTIISEMDYNNKVIYTQDMLIISLELYLGKDHKFYQFPDYLKQNFEQSQIIPDVVTSFSQTRIIPATDKTLLSEMVYAGKQLYLKDLMLPENNDADKIGYKPEQIKWCQENESYMWRYFIEKELLYANDSKLASRFINPAPFSKFYLEIDNESPGRVGAWIGWQIVRSFATNNTAVSNKQLLAMDAKELFEKSKYKPQK